MPPRRRGGNTASRSGQSTLSFGSQSRVTKPAAPPAIQKAKSLESKAGKATSATPEPQQIPVVPDEPSKPHVAELAVRQQATEETKEPLAEEDLRALKLSKQDIQCYWKKEEQSRKAPRGEMAGRWDG